MLVTNSICVRISLCADTGQTPVWTLAPQRHMWVLALGIRVQMREPYPIVVTAFSRRVLASNVTWGY
jgi:hypothetical protein